MSIAKAEYNLHWCLWGRSVVTGYCKTIDTHATHDAKACRGQPTTTRENSLFEIIVLKKGLASASGLAPLLFVSGLVLKDMHKKDMHKAQDQMDSVS